jgi:hypothetical protein
MLRNVLLFCAAVLLSLTAGRAFWVSLGENPFNMSGATYVEFFQQLDRRIAIPIAVTGIGSRSRAARPPGNRRVGMTPLSRISSGVSRRAVERDTR